MHAIVLDSDFGFIKLLNTMLMHMCYYIVVFMNRNMLNTFVMHAHLLDCGFHEQNVLSAMCMHKKMLDGGSPDLYYI